MLHKELLEEETGRALVRKASTVAASTASDAETEGPSPVSSPENEEEALVPIEEIRTSTEPAMTFPRRWGGRPRPGAATMVPGEPGGRFRRREVSLFIGPPPPAQGGPGGAERLLLVGGLPWWLSDTELRRFAEQFGAIRAIRILERSSSGKSLGVALLEYYSAEAVQKAAHPSQGLCSLSSWASMAEARPKNVLVSPELLSRLRAGELSWSEGGACSEDLRTILLRQFDTSHIAGGRPAGRPSGSPRQAGSRALALLPDASPEANRGGKEEGWADKLKRLQANVNRRQSSSELLGETSKQKQRRK